LTDTRTGAEVARAAPGTNGFLRGSLRGLMRLRKISENRLTAPFILARWPNGHLTLEDSTTKLKIDLFAFGPTNAAVFEAFLPKAEGVNP
jgi:putative photosynthetic complex assembly protein